MQQGNLTKISSFVTKKWDDIHCQTVQCSYSWPVSNFTNFCSDKSKSITKSPIFYCDNHQFRIYLSKNRELKVVNSFLCAHVHMVNLLIDTAITTQIKFSVLNGKKENSTEYTSVCMFSPLQRVIGFDNFINIDYALNPANNLLHDDAVTIRCDIIVHTDTIVSVHQAKLCNDLDLMLLNGNFSDITLTTGGKKFKAHKNILAARSPVFAAMFKDNVDEIKLPQMDEETLGELLSFVYTGKLESVPKLANNLIAAANKFELHGLKTMCENILSNNLAIDNAAGTLVIADSYDASTLKLKAIEFIVENAKEVIETPSFHSLTVTHQCLFPELFCRMAKRQKI